ncbi:MAG: hypothetical protein K2O78_02760 [Muribaculaceae bacterium]|nr:hypothetical protein [Muribaculaceae bacterium]
MKRQLLKRLSQTAMARIAPLLPLALIAACSNSEPDKEGEANEPIAIDWSVEESDVAENMEAMAFRMISDYYSGAGEDQGIVIMSPYCAQVNMSMISNGAGNSTLEQARELFATDDLGVLNAMHKKLGDVLPRTDAKTKVKIAGNVWLNDGYKAQDAFSRSIADAYNAEVTNAALDSESGRTAINSWISDATEGLISEYLPSPPGVNAFAVNAIYFNGEWTVPFKAASPEVRKFYNIDKTETAVAYMQNDATVRYGEQPGVYQAVEIPFGNGSYAFTIYLPAEEVSVDEVLVSLASGPGAASQLEEIPLRVVMPKFKVAGRANLSALWGQLGYPDLLGENSSYPGICDREIKFTRMLQALYLDVNERGAEMAAVTTTYDATALSPGDLFTVDRPFAFTVSSPATGVVLMGGVVRKL